MQGNTVPRNLAYHTPLLNKRTVVAYQNVPYQARNMAYQGMSLTRDRCFPTKERLLPRNIAYQEPLLNSCRLPRNLPYQGPSLTKEHHLPRYRSGAFYRQCGLIRHTEIFRYVTYHSLIAFLIIISCVLGVVITYNIALFACDLMTIINPIINIVFILMFT